MATQSFNLKETTISWYGTGGAWSHKGTYGVSNGDNNTFYIGGSSKYRAKLQITIPESLVISSIKKLVIRLDGYGQNSGTLYPKRTRGLLTATNLTSSNYGDLKDLNDIVTSYLYKDAEGESRITSSFSCASGTECYMIFDLSETSFKAGDSLYIYILPYNSDSAAVNEPYFTNTWMQWRNNPGTAARLDPVLYYESRTKAGAPSTLTVSSSKPKVGTSVTFKWANATSGDNNTITGYRLYYNNSSTRNSSQYKTISSNKTSGSVVYTNLGGYSKETKVYFWIQTIVDDTGYNSAIPTESMATYTIIDTPPTKPTFSFSDKVPYNGNERTIQIQNLKSSDADGDSIAYSYQIKDGSQVVKYSGSMPKDNKVTMAKGWTITITATAGGVSISSEALTPEVNVAPVIKAINYSLKQYDGFSNFLESASYTLDTSNSIVKWDWKLNQSLSLGTTEKLSNVELKGISANRKIELNLTVTDKYGDTGSKSVTTEINLLGELPAITNFDIQRKTDPYGPENEDGTSTVSGKYFNKLLEFTYTPEDFSSATNLPITAKLVAENSKTSDITVLSTWVLENKTGSKEIDSSLIPGEEYKFYIALSDKAGQSDSSNIITKTRAPYIELPSTGTYNLNAGKQGVWDIWKDSLSLSVYYSSEWIGYVQPRLEVQIGSNWYDIIIPSWDWPEGNNSKDKDAYTLEFLGGSTLNLQISEKKGAELLIKYRGLFNIIGNKKQPVKYRFYYQNCFGLASTNESYCKTFTLANSSYYLESRSAPEASSNALLYSPKIQFLNENEKYVSYDQETRFHRNEYIEFIPAINKNSQNSIRDLFTDKNEGDILKYNLYYWLGTDGNTEYFIKTLSAEEINNNRIEVGDTDWIKNIDKETSIIIGIKAEDSTGLLSEAIKTESSLLYCRKGTISAEVKKVTSETTNEGKALKIELQFLDCGGNEQGNANFQRKIGKSTPKSSFEIQASNNINFESNDDDSKVSVMSAPIPVFNNEYGLTTNPPNLTFSLNNTGLSQSSKIYIRIIITVNVTHSTNSLNQITYTTPTFIYYADGPTISYRPHQIGINTDTPENESVLTIYPSAANKNIIIIRDDGTKMNINLTDGTITGFIIQGGTWDT